MIMHRLPDRPRAARLAGALVLGAAALIAREAGAAVTDAFGRPLNYNKRDPRAFGLLISAPAIHDAAVERLAERAREIAG